MIQTVNKDQFRHAFQNMGRGEQFSYEALGILFDWIEQLDDDTGTETELDVIAICCDFTEMTLSEVIRAYDLEKDTTIDEVYQWLAEQTLLCGMTSEDKYIFQQF